MKKENMQTDETHDLAKWLAGEMTEAELSAFRNSPEFDAYERIADASRDFSLPDWDENAMLSKIISSEKPKTKTKIRPLYAQNWLRVAAVLIVSLGLFFVLRPNGRTEQTTAFGKIASAALPDKSQVTLNSGSEIAFDESTWDEHRELSLKGEAFFKVAKGRKFDVNTALGKVTVVGTQFNVKARGQRFEVECFEGKVKVRTAHSETLLQKGDIAIFESGKPVEGKASDKNSPAWMRGEIAFTSASIEQVISEFERKFDRKIKCDAQIDQTVTGSFPADDFQKAIANLCAIYKLSAKTQNGVVILSANE